MNDYGYKPRRASFYSNESRPSSSSEKEQRQLHQEQQLRFLQTHNEQHAHAPSRAWNNNGPFRQPHVEESQPAAQHNHGEETSYLFDTDEPAHPKKRPPYTPFPNSGVRPALRLQYGSNKDICVSKPLSPDDVFVVPALFGQEENMTLFHDLLAEMEELFELDKEQRKRDLTSIVRGSKYNIAVLRRPDRSPTFQKVVRRLCEYFQLRPNSAGSSLALRRGTAGDEFRRDDLRVNKNIIITALFGATREVAFLRSPPPPPQPPPLAKTDPIYTTHQTTATNSSCSPPPLLRIYLSQPNNTVVSIGQGVNIRWLRGTNASRHDSDEQETSCWATTTPTTPTSSSGNKSTDTTDTTVTVIVRGWSDAVVAAGEESSQTGVVPAGGCVGGG